MRQHGRASIDPSNPRALGICDRCGAMYNHHQLKWLYDWRGTKLQNLRFLVCDSCYDQYQQNGQRTIILPPDPIPIMNARPEQYVPDSNPLSAIGANPSPARWQFSGQIGNMTEAAGVPAAFDGNANKPSFMSAMITTPNSSFENYVGINWSGYQAIVTPSSLSSPVLTHTISSVTITAPNDSVIGSSKYAVQGSNDLVTWTTLASGDITGTIGEVIGDEPVGGRYSYHRVAFYAGASPIAVAQVELSVSDGSSLGIPA